MVREQLTKVLNLRISPREHEMLDRLAGAVGLTMGALIRQLIRGEHAAKFGDDPSPAPRTKRPTKR
jgi:hypothetical protein